MGRALDSISTLARSGAAAKDLQQQKMEMGGWGVAGEDDGMEFILLVLT